jgi:hypothetical protein
MLTFIIGLFIGALVGIVTMSLLVMSKDRGPAEGGIHAIKAKGL